MAQFVDKIVVDEDPLAQTNLLPDFKESGQYRPSPIKHSGPKTALFQNVPEDVEEFHIELDNDAMIIS
jgi:hypothetical protein